MSTVLIVDDSPTQLACLRNALPQLRVVQRGSCDLRKGRVLPDQVDLVLMALNLAQQNGFECGLLLRECGFSNVVLYSDCPAETDADWTRAIGLQGLLQWPAPVQILQQQVQTCLSRAMQGSENGKRWAS